MTARRHPLLDRPALPPPPPPPPPTRVEISGDLARIARAMQSASEDMIYIGGFGEMAARGRELQAMAQTLATWSREVRKP